MGNLSQLKLQNRFLHPERHLSLTPWHLTDGSVLWGFEIPQLNWGSSTRATSNQALTGNEEELEVGVCSVPFMGYFFYLEDNLVPHCPTHSQGVPHRGNLFRLADTTVALVLYMSYLLCLPACDYSTLWYPREKSGLGSS